MSHYPNETIYIVAFFLFFGVIANIFLLFIILKSKTKKLGRYKWFLLSYALFEAFNSAGLLIGMPMHYVSEKTWIFFTFKGPFMGTSLVRFGSTTCCLFYELWMGLIVANFVYRYIVFCRKPCLIYIGRHPIAMFSSITLIATLFISMCVVCTMFLCTENVITETMKATLKEAFEIEDIDNIGYAMLRFHDIDGNLSIAGIVATIIHFFIVITSCFAVFFCSFHIWKEIRLLESITSLESTSLERQIFKTLLLQAGMPLLLSHIPSVLYLTFPLWEQSPFGKASNFFPIGIAMSKAVDPMSALWCIVEYRNTALNMFR